MCPRAALLQQELKPASKQLWAALILAANSNPQIPPVCAARRLSSVRDSLGSAEPALLQPRILPPYQQQSDAADKELLKAVKASRSSPPREGEFRNGLLAPLCPLLCSGIIVRELS